MLFKVQTLFLCLCQT